MSDRDKPFLSVTNPVWIYEFSHPIDAFCFACPRPRNVELLLLDKEPGRVRGDWSVLVSGSGGSSGSLWLRLWYSLAEPGLPPLASCRDQRRTQRPPVVMGTWGLTREMQRLNLWTQLLGDTDSDLRVERFLTVWSPLFDVGCITDQYRALQCNAVADSTEHWPGLGGCWLLIPPVTELTQPGEESTVWLWPAPGVSRERGRGWPAHR